jgi:hypothetical protein
MTDDSIYQPSVWGQLYHATDAHEILGGGTAGPGKTTALIADPFKQFLFEHDRCLLPRSHPMYHPFSKPGEAGDSRCWALFLRRSATMLAQTVEKAARMLRAIDPNVTMHKQSGDSTLFYLSSGARYQFDACRDLVSYEKFMGHEFTWIGFDEINQFDENQYHMIRRRCRTSDPWLAAMRRRCAMGNPALRMEGESFTVRNPYWAREYFVDPAPHGGRMLKQKIVLEDGTVEWWKRIFLPARLSDNPDPMFRRQYELDLRAGGGPKHVIDALLDGNWYLTASTYYTELDVKIHVVEPFLIPKGWANFRSMDWGFKKPGIVQWFAQDPDENIILRNEWMFQGRFDNEVAAGIRAREEKMGLWGDDGSKITGPADDQIWEERGANNVKTIAQTFADLGVPWVKAEKGPGSRKKHAHLLIEKLKDKPRRKGVPPGFVMFDQCQETYKCIAAVQEDPDDPECPMDTKSDHPHDALLYALAYASKGLPAHDGDEEHVPWDTGDDDPYIGEYGAVV